MTPAPADITQLIVSLAALWYKLVALDHHKERDCQWSIEIVWRQDQPPAYRVAHRGYVHREVSVTKASLVEAEKELVRQLVTAFDEQFAWARGALAHPEEFDADLGRRILALRDEFDRIRAASREKGAFPATASTGWIPAQTPPPMAVDEWLLWQASVVVLVHEKDGTIRTAKYEQVDEDASPCWYSADSERWILENVTHWMPLPPSPGTA